MAHYIIATVPIHGHVSPLLPIARHLVDRGDDVRFLTGSRFADAVAATGATHVALPAAADYDDRDLTAKFPERSGLSPVKSIAFDFEHIFVRPAEPQLHALQALRDQEEADAVIVDPLFTAGALLTRLPADRRPPVVVAGVVPLSLASRDVAPMGLGLPPMPGPIGRLRNSLLTRFTDRMVFREVDRAGAEIAARTVGGDESSLVRWLAQADAVLQLSVESFEYPRPDAPDTLVFTGPVTASATTAHPLPEWWGDLDDGLPVVHVTQGTIANDDLGELVLPTLRGLADADVLVVVATGGRPVAELGELPANVRAAEFLPYDELFARTDVFVTNGGYGGAHFSLAHGVPMVVAPGKEDKVEVAARIAWSGVGVNLKTQRPVPQQVARAVRHVLDEPRFREAARRIGADIAASPGAAGFAAAVERTVARHPAQAERARS
jgi:MGT family glycosyltransferase